MTPVYLRRMLQTVGQASETTAVAAPHPEAVLAPVENGFRKINAESGHPDSHSGYGVGDAPARWRRKRGTSNTCQGATSGWVLSPRSQNEQTASISMNDVIL